MNTYRLIEEKYRNGGRGYWIQKRYYGFIWISKTYYTNRDKAISALDELIDEEHGFEIVDIKVIK